MTWLVVSLEFIIGIALLTWSADRFIYASSQIAKNRGWPPLLVGMLLVGFGTSFPELVVSFLSALHDKPGISIGNAIGSNIANVGMCVGITAMITPVMLHSKLLKREFPIMMVASILVGLLLWNGYLSQLDGIILLAALIFYLYWMFFYLPRKEHREDALVTELEHEQPKGQISTGRAVVIWVLSLGLLVVASELIVKGAVTIAELLEINELIIGLTIVAIGTSLPELAVTVASACRREHDIAIGNVVGSNIFNLLAVLVMPALLSPTILSPSLLHRDYPLMLVFSGLFWALAYLPKRGQLGRGAGAFLFVAFVGYMIYLVLTVM